MLCLSMISACSGNKIDVEIIIEPIGNQIAYKTTSFTVTEGQRVKLIMNNVATAAAMKHNVVILNTKEAIEDVSKQALTAPGYIPSHPAIIVYTPITESQQQSEVIFIAPSAGNYPYLCTFTGHSAQMRGEMTVLKK